MDNSNQYIDDILTDMVENTHMIFTKDLPSLLMQEEVYNYRRVHKDQILKNLPKAKQALLQWRDSAVRELLSTGLYAERASYQHPQTPPELNWPIITEPVYIVPASAVSDLVKPDFYNNKGVTNPQSEATLNKEK